MAFRKAPLQAAAATSGCGRCIRCGRSLASASAVEGVRRADPQSSGDITRLLVGVIKPPRLGRRRKEAKVLWAAWAKAAGQEVVRGPYQ